MSTEKHRSWKSFLDQRLQLLFFSFVFIFGVLGSLFALVKDPSVRISEISKFSTLMVTVTGILVGLSPLIQKDRRRWVNLGIISLLVSLVTVVIADTATPDQSTYVSEVFVLSLILFVITVLAYATYATNSSVASNTKS